MASELLKKIKLLVFNKSFLVGFLLSLAFFSHYIFGNDNLLEQAGEFFIKITTNRDVDFTPESGSVGNNEFTVIMETFQTAR